MQQINNLDLRFCWRTLPKVSRSFALCIKMLPEKTKDAVMISYLLCRVADTIEDSRLSDEEKIKHLNYFKLVLQTEVTTQEKLYKFGQMVAEKAPIIDEQKLVKNTHRVMKCFSKLPDKPKQSITKWVTEMAEGMKQYSRRNIKTFSDQNVYGYYVAGTVGNLMIELFHYYGHISDSSLVKLRELATDFGVALQKVNVIRDFLDDIKEGRRYWPEHLLKKYGLNYDNLGQADHHEKSAMVLKELVADARMYLSKGLSFIMLLPKKEISVRVFCAIPLFMAVATLELCTDAVSLFMKQQSGFPSPKHIGEIVENAIESAGSNEKLKQWYAQLSIPMAKKVSA